MSASSNSLEATHLGGTDSGAANTIAFNGEAGVQVAAGTGNSILRNFLFSNGGLGIDLRENTTDNRTRPAKRRVGKNGMGSDKRFRLRVLVLLAAVVLAAGLLLLKTKPAEATFPGDNGRIAFVSDRTTGAGVDNPTGDLYRFCVILAQNVQRACEGVKAMSGVIEPVDWHHSADELHECYKAERELEARKRLGALWLVRQGESVSSAAQSMGVGRRTLTRWLSWYREGGLEEVLSRVPGHGALGNECWLSEHQQQELVERSGRGEFRTYEEARQWVEQQWGVEYRYKGMYALLARLGVRPKVPRPAAEKADPEVQEAWKRGAF